MRHTFSDGATVQARAKRNLDDGRVQIRRWWSDKYDLPPNHPLFRERSLADIQIEMVEDLMQRRKQLRKQIDDDGDKGGKLLAEINDIDEALGDKPTVIDDLWDIWEQDLAAGRTPDLDAMPS